MTTRLTRALSSAPAHITHGSSVTRRPRGAQRHNFGVRRRVPVNLAAILTHGDDDFVFHQHTTDRHVIVRARLCSGLECQTHELFVVAWCIHDDEL
jgi:hypothetical protein